MSAAILCELRALADPEQTRILQHFFKTDKGEYGEGDVFLGIRMPARRAFSRQHEIPSQTGLQALLDSSYHEARMLALLFLMRRYRMGRDDGCYAERNIRFLSCQHRAYQQLRPG